MRSGEASARRSIAAQNLPTGACLIHAYFTLGVSSFNVLEPRKDARTELRRTPCTVTWQRVEIPP